MSTIGGVIALLIPWSHAMTDSDPFPKRDARNRRSRLEIRTVLALVALVIVGGGIWVALNGSPNADRRAIDSGNAAGGSLFNNTDPAPQR